MSDPEFICQCIFEHVGSRKKDPTAKYLMNNLDDCIDRIQNWIISDSWIPSKPIHTTHIEPSNGKIREIYYVPFYPDCVIHWILIDSIYDKVVPKMDPYCVDHTIIRKRTIKRLTRLCHIISKRKYPTLEQANSAACRIGQLKHADMHNYRVKYVDNVISYKAIRRRISVESRRMQREAS